jgi:antitoxin component of MazEF toxin-antitoxin module
MKYKLRQIGNCLGITFPKSDVLGYSKGDEIEVEIVKKVITESKKEESVITPERKHFNTEMCPKHEGSMKGTCGCE